MALSVMVFTGAMAQQKSTAASMKAKANEDVKLSKKSLESSQSANTEVILDAQDLKAKAEEQKKSMKQKVKDKKEVLAETLSNTKGSTSSEVGISGTLNGDTHGADVSTAAQSELINSAKGTVVSHVASVKNQGNVAVKTAGNLSSQLNSGIKSGATDVKAGVNVKTDVNVKPTTINTTIKTATGIKL